MTVTQLIAKLSGLKQELQDKEICIIAENGLYLAPQVRFKLIDDKDIFNLSAANVDKIVLTWQ